MSDIEKKNSYRSILKGTSFLGGTQIFLILISFIRGKFIAMLLGPEGMGIANLFTNSANTIQRFSSLGLNLSIVKEVAECSENTDALSRIKSVTEHLTFATAIVGALFCFFFSGWLSKISFGDSSYSWQFMLLSVMIFFTVAGNGKMSILQGMHEVKALSKSTIIGALTGLCTSVPLYWFFGNKGIVPALVVFSFVTYISYSIFLKIRFKTQDTVFKLREHKPLIRKLISLGLVLMAGDLIGSLCNYLLSIFISHSGDLYSLGLYQAANSITTQYLGVIFAAMSLDYFPRLTAAASDNVEMTEIVNRQSLLVALATAPLAILLIAFAPLVIIILLSDEFASVAMLLRLFAIGVLFKAFSFPMGYITFAKGNKSLFFILEGLFCNFLTLTLGCFGFHFFGVIGMGYAMIADFFICIIVYYAVNGIKYKYRFSRDVINNYILATILTVGAFLSTGIENKTVSFTILGAITIYSISYSIIKIRQLIKN